MLQATVNGTRYFLRLYVNEDSQYSSRPVYANMGSISDKGWLSTHKGGVFKGDKGINAQIVHRPDTKVWLNQTKVTANELVIFNPTNNFRESWKK